MPKDYFLYKIMILWDNSIGKTCFLNRYIDDTFDEKTYKQMEWITD